jgi:hypothetical protein
MLRSSNLFGAVLLMLVSATSGADIRSATGKPLLDFYTVFGLIGNVRAMKDVCNERYPAMKNSNEKSYAEWQDRYKAFRYKIEQYHDEISKKTAKGSDPAKRYREDAMQYEGQKKQTHELFLSFGEQGYRQACENYSAYTKSEKADFAVYMAEHMRVFESYWAKQSR